MHNAKSSSEQFKTRFDSPKTTFKAQGSIASIATTQTPIKGQLKKSLSNSWRLYRRNFETQMNTLFLNKQNNSRRLIQPNIPAPTAPTQNYGSDQQVCSLLLKEDRVVKMLHSYRPSRSIDSHYDDGIS